MGLSLAGFAFALYVVVACLLGTVDVQGWASVIVVVSISSGVSLFALGVVAEYIGVAVNMAMGGASSYLIVRRSSTCTLCASPPCPQRTQPTLVYRTEVC